VSLSILHSILKKRDDILNRKCAALAAASVLFCASLASAEKVKFAIPMQREVCEHEEFTAYVRDMAFVENDPASQTVTFYDIKKGCLSVLYPKFRCEDNEGACHAVMDHIESGAVFNVFASRADQGKKYNAKVTKFYMGRAKELVSTETDYSKYQAIREGKVNTSIAPISR
jgi:hypothetical protein